MFLINIWAVTWDFQQCGMCDQQSLRSAWAYAQTGQSLCYSLKYSMTVKLLTENTRSFYAEKEAAEARLSLHLSKCHVVGNHMSRLISTFIMKVTFLAHMSMKYSMLISRCPSYVMRRQQFALNDNCSYTTKPISSKLHRTVP